MRFVALALILATLPIFVALLNSNPRHRNLAYGLLTALLFVGGSWRISAYFIGWPLWAGTVRGLEVSPVDMLALALILTRRTVRPGIPFWPILGFYGATLLLSLMLSSVPVATAFVCWQYLRMLLLFAALAGESNRDDVRRAIVAGLSCGLLLQAGFVIQQKLTGVVQASGTIGHQNSLGMMVELAALPLLAALLAGDRRKIVLAGLAAALVIVAGGGSRATMGIVGGGLFVLLILSLARNSTPNKMKVLGIAVLAMAVAVPLSLTTLKERFGSASIVTQESERAAFERAARAIAADHPFGVGANLYVTTANVQGYAQRAGVAWNFFNRSAPVHNAYLLARSETGWLGEFAFILVLVVPLGTAVLLAFRRRRDVNGEIALGSAVAIALNIVHNNFEFAVFTSNVMALLMVNIGLIAGQVQASRLAKSQVGGTRLVRPLTRRNDLPSQASAQEA